MLGPLVTSKLPNPWFVTVLWDIKNTVTRGQIARELERVWRVHFLVAYFHFHWEFGLPLLICDTRATYSATQKRDLFHHDIRL